MGYYINIGGAKGKVNALLPHGAVIVSRDQAAEAMQQGKGVVCVVDNGLFEAAGYCYSQNEFDAFAWGGDHRPKTWLVMEVDTARKLSGYK